MQLVLALLAIMLYAAVFAAGIIITGIVEIVKHIRRQNRNPRKVKETKNLIPKSRGHSEEMEVKSIASISEDTSEKDLEICEIPSDLITEVNAPGEFISDDNFESCSPSRVASSARDMITTNELAIFNNMIYHVKLLGHEDPRFQLITIKAYELISQFGDSENFFEDILKSCTGENDFASEIIRFIII